MAFFSAQCKSPRLCLKWRGLGLGLAAAAVLLLGGCVSFHKIGPGGKRMMELHYEGEAGKVVGAMVNPGAQPAEAAPATEPAAPAEPEAPTEPAAPPEA